MQELIASYLFQRKNCPLPGLGSLLIKQTGAQADFSVKEISAPGSLIEFIPEISDEQGLINYVARSTGTGVEIAKTSIEHFCDGLKHSLKVNAGVQLRHIGELFSDAAGIINLRQTPLPEAFIQPVNAERVIHPDAQHQILVGDKETTNTVMAELLSPKDVTRDLWWIWAIVLTVAAAALITYYFMQDGVTWGLGNSVKI